MAKTDVKSAFRIIPIYPSCILLTTPYWAYAGTICITSTEFLPKGCLVLVLFLNPLAPPLNGYP